MLTRILATAACVFAVASSADAAGFGGNSGGNYQFAFASASSTSNYGGSVALSINTSNCCGGGGVSSIAIARNNSVITINGRTRTVRR